MTIVSGKSRVWSTILMAVEMLNFKDKVVEVDTCAICLVATEFVAMPCCERETGTTRFCFECIRTVCENKMLQPALCPNCREHIKMGKAGPVLCKQAVWPRLRSVFIGLIWLLLLLAMASCPSHDDFVAHLTRREPIKPHSWLSSSSIRSIDSQAFFFFRVGWGRQSAFVGACGLWWSLPNNLSVDQLSVIMINSFFLVVTVMALMNREGRLNRSRVSRKCILFLLIDCRFSVVAQSFSPRSEIKAR